MTKEEFEKKHLVSKKQLHDIMIKKGEEESLYLNKCLEKNYLLDKKELSDLIYEYIKYIDNQYKEHGEFNFFSLNYPNKKIFDLNYQDSFKRIEFYKYKDDMYFYFKYDKNISIEDMKNFIIFLEKLLENYKGLNYENELKYVLNKKKQELYSRLISTYGDKKEEILNYKPYYIENDQIKRYNDINKYNYFIKLQEKNKIDINDVFICTQYLGADSNNLIDLDIKKIISLNLIVFNGIKNTYFNSSNLFKNENKDMYYGYLKVLPDYMNSFEILSKGLTDKIIYSNDYFDKINLENEIINYNMVAEQHYKIIRRYYNKDCYLKETLKLIYFEYLIENLDFEQAKEYINKNKIYLYANLENILNMLEDISQEEVLKYLMDTVITDYNLYKNDSYRSILNFNDITQDTEYIILYVNPTLKFIINYFEFLKNTNQQEKAAVLYNFIRIFRNIGDIENFFIKCEYEYMCNLVADLKTDSDDEDEINETITKIEEKIDEKELVDEYDIERVVHTYPYINFNNLDERVKKYIATGDIIISVFKKLNNTLDYSSAVIEWSKAVELETYNKLTSKLKKHEKDINDVIKNEHYFTIGTTIGTIAKMDNTCTNNNQKLTDYLYDKYFSKWYDISRIDYQDLIKKIIVVHNPRNKSAHKDEIIELENAKRCQDIILASKKILEKFSNLKEK